MSGPNYEDLENIEVNFDEIKEAVAQRDAGFGKPLDPNRYYLGMGDSIVRVVPFWNEVKQCWSTQRKVDVHVVKGTEYLCMRSEHGVDCLFCEWFFEHGNEIGYKNVKFKKFCGMSGVRAKYQAAMNVQVVEDCKDPGEGKFTRPKYNNGDLLYTICGHGVHGDFLGVLGNPDYKDATSPTKGRDLRVVRKLDKNKGQPETDISARPDRRRLDEGFPVSMKEILEKCTDFFSWDRWVAVEGKAAVDVRTYLEGLNEKLEKAMGSGDAESGEASSSGAKETATKAEDMSQAPTSVTNVPDGDDGSSAEDEKPGGAVSAPASTPAPVPEKPAATASAAPEATKSLPVVGMAPTREESGGKRLCLNKGVKDTTNIECQMCPEEMTCDE